MGTQADGEQCYLDIDIGSVIISYVLLTGRRDIVPSDYLYHHGDIGNCLHHITERLNSFFITQLGYNDRAADFFKGGIGYNEQVALIEGLRVNYNTIDSTFSIGGETFGLTLFSKNNRYKKYISNSSCAAGTGSFLYQQADRIALSDSVELSTLAERYTGDPPQIAIRCAVFAKTDLIHCQQKGYSFEAIAAGLCKSLAHNYLTNKTSISSIAATGVLHTLAVNPV